MVKRKITGRKTTKKGVGRKTTRKATTRYVVNATFNMRSPHVTKVEADKIAKSVKRKGGTTTIRKV